MIYSVDLAKGLMGEGAIKEAIAFQRKLEKEEELGVENSSGHKPNLLNTVVFLVETSQQEAVMLVNNKGRPWMKGATENPALLYSLLALVVAVIVAAWELVPQLNEQLGLVELPNDEVRFQLLALLGVTLVGSFAWDRLCLALFAPTLFAAQLAEFRSLSMADFVGPNTGRNVGMATAAAAWLYYTEGNVVLLGLAYMFYKRLGTPNADIKPPAAAGSPAPRAAS